MLQYKVVLYIHMMHDSPRQIQTTRVAPNSPAKTAANNTSTVLPRSVCQNMEVILVATAPDPLDISENIVTPLPMSKCAYAQRRRLPCQPSVIASALHYHHQYDRRDTIRYLRKME